MRKVSQQNSNISYFVGNLCMALFHYVARLSFRSPPEGFKQFSRLDRNRGYQIAWVMKLFPISYSSKFEKFPSHTLIEQQYSP